tara:strand:- start:316 stop:606 length:291 start_codon:yes stop_codon:yes gene_type:complete
MNDFNEQDTIWLASDLEALCKVTFVRVLEKAKKKYGNPKDYFSSLGIVLPKRIDRWDQIDEHFLLEIEKIIFRAKKCSELKTIIISTKGKIIQNGD